MLDLLCEVVGSPFVVAIPESTDFFVMLKLALRGPTCYYHLLYVGIVFSLAQLMWISFNLSLSASFEKSNYARGSCVCRGRFLVYVEDGAWHSGSRFGYF
jgi:hypothetical protein